MLRTFGVVCTGIVPAPSAVQITELWREPYLKECIQKYGDDGMSHIFRYALRKGIVPTLLHARSATNEEITSRREGWMYMYYMISTSTECTIINRLVFTIPQSEILLSPGDKVRYKGKTWEVLYVNPKFCTLVDKDDEKKVVRLWEVL